MLVPSLFSCSNAPELREIEPRLKELVEASYEINDIFFGDGLDTYLRVTDPKSSTDVIEIPYVDENGVSAKRKVWYYYAIDEENKVIAYRDSYLKNFSYALESKEELSKNTLQEKFPLPDGADAGAFYETIYTDTTKGIYCYSIPYEEPHFDFYYSAADPKEYDYVSFEEEYQTIDSIKEAAEAVYSAEYLADIYDTMFVGSSEIENAGGLATLSPRYIEYTDDMGTAYLMKSNTYEPLISERRIYDFSTAEIVKRSNSKYLTVQIESYLESAPDDRLTVKLTMTLQDGEWYLDSATY